MDLNLKYIEVKNVQIYSGREVDFHLSYQNFGQDINQFPVVVVNHSLTGNSNVSGQNGWWKDLIGKNKLIDTDRFAVLAFNIPGNCFGKEKNEFLDDLILGDVAKAFNIAISKLGINRVHSLIGGSVGGGLVWEMGALNPELFENLIPIAANYKSSDWLLANTYLQSKLLENSSDPIVDARIHAMLTYRNPLSLNKKFQNETGGFSRKVTNWLDFHGDTLKNRFELDAYKTMNKFLSSIDIETYANSNIENLIKKIKSNVYIISINTDLLFTDYELRETYKKLSLIKNNIYYYQIKSNHGHDAFFIEFDQIKNFLKDCYKE
tara:strand:- start:220 stop:1182 length:963 start_codon:yes stop_codon:yes gene_type:complete